MSSGSAFSGAFRDDSTGPECHRQFPTATCNRARGEFWRERVLERAEAIEVTDLNTEPRRRARRYTELIWPADSAVRRWARAARARGWEADPRRTQADPGFLNPLVFP